MGALVDDFASVDPQSVNFVEGSQEVLLADVETFDHVEPCLDFVDY